MVALQVLYMTIASVKKGSPVKRGGREGTPIEVHCKDFQVQLHCQFPQAAPCCFQFPILTHGSTQILNFLIPRAVDAAHVHESLTKFSLPGKA